LVAAYPKKISAKFKVNNNYALQPRCRLQGAHKPTRREQGGNATGPCIFLKKESDAGVHCTHVFAHAGEKRSTPDAMGMPFDALYEHANDYDYDYDYEHDYDRASRNARKIIHTKAPANTIRYTLPKQTSASI
jgi:hypothetical protein